MGVHPDLRGTLFLNLVFGPIFAIVGMVVFVYIIVSGGSARGIPGWCLFFYGVTMAFLGWAMLVSAPRWYRRATWVLGNTRRQPMRMALREQSWSDSTDLWADLQAPDAGRTSAPVESYRLLRPRWNVMTLNDPVVSVHRDPQPGGPVVIETSKGVLWPMPNKNIDLGLQRLRRKPTQGITS